jgi:hypothetical protein
MLGKQVPSAFANHPHTIRFIGLTLQSPSSKPARCRTKGGPQSLPLTSVDGPRNRQVKGKLNP